MWLVHGSSWTTAHWAFTSINAVTEEKIYYSKLNKAVYIKDTDILKVKFRLYEFKIVLQF